MAAEINPVDPQTWVDLSRLMDGTNTQLLLAVSVLTFILYRVKAVPNQYADLVPFVLGALCGLRSGVEQGYSIMGYSLAGAAINGAAAWVVAQVAGMAWQKLYDLAHGPVPAPAVGPNNTPSPGNGKAKEQ